MGEIARQRNIPLVCLLVAYTLLAVGYSAVMPLGEAPDEVSHYAYARYLALEHDLPPPAGPARGEVFQPPLYYALGALVSWWIPEGDFSIKANSDYAPAIADQVPNVLLHTRQEAFPWRDGALAWHLMRLVSVEMGIITVWATYALALLAFPHRPWLALAAAAFNAFLPEFLFISGAVNNDNLAAMLAGLILLQAGRVMASDTMEQHRPVGTLARVIHAGSNCPWIWLGVLLGLGFWTKLSMLVFMPLAGALLLWVAARGGDPRAEALDRSIRWALAMGIPAFLITLPWAWHNLMTWGDPLGWALLRQVTEALPGPLTWHDYQVWLVDLYQSFWGRFGGAAHVRLPGLLYWFLGMLVLGAITGMGRLAWRYLRGEGNPQARRLLPFLGLHICLVASLMVLWANTNKGTGQARLAYPALGPISIFFTVGLAEIGAWVGAKDRQGRSGIYHTDRLVAGGLAGGMLALAAAVLLGFLLPLYHLPQRIALGDIPAAARRGPFDFGGEVRLLGWQLERTILTPGEVTYVTLYWQALRPPEEDYWLFLRLETDDGKVVWSKDGSPSAGRDSTDLWREGDVLMARHRIALAEDIPLGRYRLLAGLHRFSKWEWLSIRDDHGRILGDTIALAGIVVGDQEKR